MIRPLRRALYVGLAILLAAGCAVTPNQPTAGDPTTATPTGAPSQGQAPLANTNGGPAANLVANGAFEGGNLEGWLPDAATASQDQAHGGSWSARLANTAMEVDIATAAGTPYKLTTWLKIVEESGQDWGGFRVAASDWDWGELAHSGWLLASDEGQGWFKVALNFTATTPQTRIQIGYFGGAGRTMVVHVDDVAAFARGVNEPPTIRATLDPTSFDGKPGKQRYSVVGDDPDGAIVRVLWDFGDGARALTATGERHVGLPGSYVATVHVADDEGAVATQMIAWTAQNAAFPALQVTTPAEQESVAHSAMLSLNGSAEGDDPSVFVSSDRDYAAPAEGSSAWSAQVPLRPGLNRILVQARNGESQISTAERLVRYVPAGPLGVSGIAESAASVERWAPLEITFALDNSAATHPQFPYDPTPTPGLEWLDGVSVDGLFTPDDWKTVYRRPAFLSQPYERAEKDEQEWLYPSGAPAWTLRFAPPTEGNWRYRIEVYEAKGTAQSAERTFSVAAPSDPANHGPIAVAQHDTRYFEYADGKPFLGTGHGVGYSNERFSYAAAKQLDTIGAGNQQFLRWWIGGQIWGSAWQPWRSRTLDNDGYVPATGLTAASAYGNGIVALRLNKANPIMFQGFDSGRAGLIPGRSYRLRVRWRIEGVAGPEQAGKPYGATIKLTDWPDPGKTIDLPTLIPHVYGDTPWHVAEADFVAEKDFVPNVTLIFENATGGAAYVDEVDLYEVLEGGQVGTQLLRNPRFNAHLTFDPRRSAGVDAILAEAAARDIAFKLVISEKNDRLLGMFAPDGLPDENGGHFSRGPGTPSHRLHTYYWRYLFARFGAFRSVQSWELLNEEAPSPGEHFWLANDLARLAMADGNPHPATISTWGSLAEEAWTDPRSAAIPYVDFHTYVRGTGWIEPKGELANDSAAFFGEYDKAARAAGFNKPIVWGEIGIDGDQGTDEQEPLLAEDQEGVWLHKLTWARSGPGGVYPLYWYTDNIFEKSLHPIFGSWNRFMAGIPLANGRYEDVAATTSVADLRVFGQKDLEAGQAHLWIDNRQHTWRAVVDGKSIAAASGTVSIAMGAPGSSYRVAWHDTSTGQPTSSETVTADASGTLVLTIQDLKSDVAAKLAREGN